MKLIIQIPCYNEEDSLQAVLAELPRRVAGVDSIERLVVDDGSRDSTAASAEAFGVEHIVRFPSHRGLARAFMAGLEAALAAGADIIVNLDADNQYCAGDIPKLIQPILDGRAEMVIGSRPIGETSHFSPVKKLLQRVGSRVVRWASGTAVADAPSGFRALSRNAALRMNVFGDYTYTLETIIQAGRRGITVVSVPIHTNAPLRPSRLIHSTLNYVIHEVGCGEGMLLASLARPGRVLYASDRSVEVVRTARLRHGNLSPPITFETVALEHLDPKRHGAPLIICCEVLEHVADPLCALGCLQCLAQPYLLVSVPREPLWRFLNMLRLKYLPDFGNTPGHLHHWSTASFVSLLNQHFQVLAVRRPLPWIMALCRSNRASAELHRARERSKPACEPDSGAVSRFSKNLLCLTP